MPVLSRTFFGGRRRYDGRGRKLSESTARAAGRTPRAPRAPHAARAPKTLVSSGQSKEDPSEAVGTGPGSEARDESRLPLPGPALRRIPTSATKPRHTPLLRANPYPEVTDPICRLPLPTLFYRLEAAHLGDRLRIWVRSSATPPRGPLPDFQGPRDRSRHRRKCGALRIPNPISALGDSRELECLCRTENSASIVRRRLRVPLGYPDELLDNVTRMPFPGPVARGREAGGTYGESRFRIGPHGRFRSWVP